MGIGFTQVSEIFVAFPELLQNIFVGNSVALTFLAAVILSACLPKDTIIDGPLVHKERAQDDNQENNQENKETSLRNPCSSSLQYALSPHIADVNLTKEIKGVFCYEFFRH